MNFREYLEQNANYENFVQYLKDNNLNINQLIQNLSRTPPDHEGGNNLFWYIKGSPYGLRMLRKMNLGTKDYNQTQFDQMNKHQDELEDIHVGQPVANIGKDIQIVKVQKGEPLGVKYKSKEDKKLLMNDFARKILMAAKLPQSAYDKLVQDIKTIHERGYRIDPSKPGNLLINNQGFGFVDVSKQEVPKDIRFLVPNLFAIIFHPRYINDIINEPGVKDAGIMIHDKIINAAKKYKLPVETISTYEGIAELLGIIKPKPVSEPINDDGFVF
jgi:hypothetical protein